MEELTRLRGDVPFGWLAALRLWLARRRARPPARPLEARAHLLPDNLHNLAAPR